MALIIKLNDDAMTSSEVYLIALSYSVFSKCCASAL